MHVGFYYPSVLIAIKLFLLWPCQISKYLLTTCCTEQQNIGWREFFRECGEKYCYPASACESWVLCYEALHNCVGDISCCGECVCEWRGVGVCCSYAIFIVIFSTCVSLFVCVTSRQCTGSPGQGQDGLQWSVRHHPSRQNQEENKDHLWQPEPSLGGEVQLVSAAC